MNKPYFDQTELNGINAVQSTVFAYAMRGAEFDDVDFDNVEVPTGIAGEATKLYNKCGVISDFEDDSRVPEPGEANDSVRSRIERVDFLRGNVWQRIRCAVPNLDELFNSALRYANEFGLKDEKAYNWVFERFFGRELLDGIKVRDNFKGKLNVLLEKPVGDDLNDREALKVALRGVEELDAIKEAQRVGGTLVTFLNGKIGDLSKELDNLYKDLKNDISKFKVTSDFYNKILDFDSELPALISEIASSSNKDGFITRFCRLVGIEDWVKLSNESEGDNDKKNNGALDKLLKLFNDFSRDAQNFNSSPCCPDNGVQLPVFSSDDIARELYSDLNNVNSVVQKFIADLKKKLEDILIKLKTQILEKDQIYNRKSLELKTRRKRLEVLHGSPLKPGEAPKFNNLFSKSNLPSSEDFWKSDVVPLTESTLDDFSASKKILEKVLGHLVSGLNPAQLSSLAELKLAESLQCRDVDSLDRDFPSLASQEGADKKIIELFKCEKFSHFFKSLKLNDKKRIDSPFANMSNFSKIAEAGYDFNVFNLNQMFLLLAGMEVFDEAMKFSPPYLRLERRTLMKLAKSVLKKLPSDIFAGEVPKELKNLFNDRLNLARNIMTTHKGGVALAEQSLQNRKNELLNDAFQELDRRYLDLSDDEMNYKTYDSQYEDLLTLARGDSQLTALVPLRKENKRWRINATKLAVYGAKAVFRPVWGIVKHTASALWYLPERAWNQWGREPWSRNQTNYWSTLWNGVKGSMAPVRNIFVLHNPDNPSLSDLQTQIDDLPNLFSSVAVDVDSLSFVDDVDFKRTGAKDLSGAISK